MQRSLLPPIASVHIEDKQPLQVGLNSKYFEKVYFQTFEWIEKVYHQPLQRCAFKNTFPHLYRIDGNQDHCMFNYACLKPGRVTGALNIF